MQEVQNWSQFWILTAAVIGASTTITVLINSLANKALKKHKIHNCNVHAEDMETIQDTNRIMLKCHDVTLQALDSISKGEKPNGEIPKQREALQVFFRNEVTKKRRKDDNS